MLDVQCYVDCGECPRVSTGCADHCMKSLAQQDQPVGRQQLGNTPEQRLLLINTMRLALVFVHEPVPLACHRKAVEHELCTAMNLLLKDLPSPRPRPLPVAVPAGAVEFARLVPLDSESLEQGEPA